MSELIYYQFIFEAILETKLVVYTCKTYLELEKTCNNVLALS